MSASKQEQSLPSQELDRTVFGTFFLGAVVPLIALGWISQQYVMPRLSADGLTAVAILGPLIGVAALTLASFFALRRIVHVIVARMDAHNQRLGCLVGASRALSEAPHPQAVAEVAGRYAVELSGGRGAAVLLTPEKGGELELYHTTDEATRSLVESKRSILFELAASAQQSGRSAALPTSAGESFAAGAIPIASRDRTFGVLLVISTGAGASFGGDAVDAVSTLASQTAVALENGRLQDSQRNFFAHTTEILASALDQHVQGRAGHAQAVARTANRIGREMGLGDSDLQTLHYAALLHDLGMLKIEPEMHLSAAACRKHAALGHRMISRIHQWREVAPIVRHHHERVDGGGYPDGLSGKAIPLAARIIAVADSVDAMRREEAHRAALSAEQIVEELQACSGTQFDGEVVAVFARLVSDGQIEL
ncbi:MAG: HD domain-containing phosphohydrolase [Myxococcota bacterium]